MDIAAIQQDTPQKIDFDQELTTVGACHYCFASTMFITVMLAGWGCMRECVTGGAAHKAYLGLPPPHNLLHILGRLCSLALPLRAAVSNMAVGLAGCGYTGSYIFSQTIFTMRAGVFSRWNGAVVAASELLLAVLPFSVVQVQMDMELGAGASRESCLKGDWCLGLLQDAPHLLCCCVYCHIGEGVHSCLGLDVDGGSNPPFLVGSSPLATSPHAAVPPCSTCPTSSSARCCSGLASRSRATGSSSH